MSNKPLRSLLSVILIYGTGVLPGQTSAQSLPDTTSAKIDQLFAKWNNLNAPGCVAGIVQGEQLVYAKGFGLANMETNTANSPSTIFYMCSVSKQFAGYAVSLLAGEGKIKLDANIRTYLPWMSDFGGQKISVSNLLNHTSGLRDDIGLSQFYGLGIDGILTQDLAVRILKNQRTLNFQPGEKFSYSNSNYVLLAEIVQSVTGKSFKSYTDSVIFKPLGMNHSVFADSHSALIPNRAASYEQDGDTYRNAVQNVYTLGDGGLFTSINDMAKWVVNFYHPRAGTPDDVERMLSRGKLSDGTEIPYAMGINVSTDRGYRRLLHNGGLAGYRTVIAIYPELKTGFFIFGNAGDGEVYNKISQIAEILIPEKSSAKQQQPSATDKMAVIEFRDSTELTRWTGNYIADNGYKIVISYKAGKLYLNDNTELAPEAKGIFHIKARSAVKYYFKTNPKNKTTRATLISPVLSKPIELQRVRRSKLSQADLQQYKGIYISSELGSSFTIEVKENELWIADKYHDPVKITVMGDDHLFTGYDFLSHIRIIRNRSGIIQYFELNSGDTTGLLFHKAS